MARSSNSKRGLYGRITPSRRARVNQIFHKIGMTPARAMALFYDQVEKSNGWPFDRHPSKESIESFNEDMSKSPAYYTLAAVKKALNG